MNNKIIPGFFFLSALSLLFWAGGCIKQPLPIYYYTLGPINQKTAAVPDKPLTNILVGPIHIASFLDQGQLITQSSSYSLTIEEQHRWAGNLKEMLTTALITNLSLEFGAEGIHIFPDSLEPDSLQVVTNFLHFEKDSDGNASVAVRWKILASNGKDMLYQTISIYKIPPENDGFDALAKALSRGLAKLSGEITERITILTASQKAP